LPFPPATCRTTSWTLFVNGESYGQLADGDGVLVENGKAKIIPP